MAEQLWIAMLVLATVGSGLIGGLFFIFSNTVMSALDRLPAAQAVAAMNTINRVILNPGFFLTFFGTALLCVVILIGQAWPPGGTSARLAVVGALFYLVGSIIVTMVYNVPLNNKLAALSPTATDMESQWRDYRGTWTRWNHVRTVACIFAGAAFAHSLAR